MKLNILKIHSFISLFFLTSILFGDEYILVPKNILDVQTGKLYEANIHIKDGLITSISNKKLAKENQQIINLSGVTLIPGLMDAHVHLIGNNELNGYSSMGESTQLATLYGAKNARSALIGEYKIDI